MEQSCLHQSAHNYCSLHTFDYSLEENNRRVSYRSELCEKCPHYHLIFLGAHTNWKANQSQDGPNLI